MVRFFSNRRRALSLIGALMIHAVVLWVLLHSFGIRAVQPTTALRVTLIQETRAERQAPPVPTKKMGAPRRPVLQIPEFDIEAPPSPEGTRNAASAPFGTGTNERPGHAITWPHVDPRRPLRDPSDSDITAAILLKITVDKSGKVTAASVVKSSGHKSLDEATIKEALRSWRLVPGTIDGKPATLPLTFWIRFWKYVADDDVRRGQNCLLSSQIGATSVLDDHRILVRMKDKTYRLLNVGTCTGLKRDGFAYDLMRNDLCEGDPVLPVEEAAVPCAIDSIANVENGEGEALFASQGSPWQSPPPVNAFSPR